MVIWHNNFLHSQSTHLADYNFTSYCMHIVFHEFCITLFISFSTASTKPGKFESVRHSRMNAPSCSVGKLVLA